MKEYTIELPSLKNKVKEESLDLINLYRQFLYQADTNWAPKEITLEESDKFKEIINPQILAKRFALFKFKGKNLEALKEIYTIVENKEEITKEIYTTDLKFFDSNNQEVQILTKDLLLFIAPGNMSPSKITIKLEKGNGIEDGKFLSYAGFSYDVKKDNYYIIVDSIKDLKTQLKEATQNLKNLTTALEEEENSNSK